MVTLLVHAYTKDSAGGRVVSSTTTIPGVVCSVEPGAGQTALDDAGRWTTESPYTLRFSTDPGLKPHDEVTWQEGGRLHHLVVTTTSNKMGRGATFEVSAIERI